MAARFCSRCGHELASAAQFCPSCGTPTHGAAGEPTRVETAAFSARRLLIPGMVAALVVLIIAVIVLAGKSPSVIADRPTPVPPAPSVLSAPPVPPAAAPAVTNAPAQPIPPAPALTNAPSKPAPTLPPDVAQYLKFLQEIEQRRIALDNDTEGASAMLAAATQMQGGQDDPDQHNTTVQKNTASISQGYADYVGKWNRLVADFRSVTPPAPCSLLANAYLAFLTDYVATISKVQVALLNHDIGAAMGAQGAQTKVNTDAVQADLQLGQLCDRYGVPKPFGIQAEGSSSPLTGL